MKRTPKDLAGVPAVMTVNAIVAASALAGILSNMIGKAVASEPSYDTKLQKSSHNLSAPEMTTYTTVYTQSFPPPGAGTGYGNDDTKTTTDAY